MGLQGVFGLKIQEKKIRIATVDRCVMCGEIIPEEKQVCGKCKYKTGLEETINCRHYVPACGGNQYTSADTAEGCIYCGHQKLEKMDKLEPEESEVEHDG